MFSLVFHPGFERLVHIVGGMIKLFSLFLACTRLVDACFKDPYVCKPDPECVERGSNMYGCCRDPSTTLHSKDTIRRQLRSAQPDATVAVDCDIMERVLSKALDEWMEHNGTITSQPEFEVEEAKHTLASVFNNCASCSGEQRVIVRLLMQCAAQKFPEKVKSAMSQHDPQGIYRKENPDVFKSLES